MIFDKCPWCEKEFSSNKYPRSAALTELRDKERTHMRNNHPQYVEKYEEIVNIWHSKVLNGRLDSIRFLFNKKRFPHISKEVVIHYDVEDIKNMDEEELRKLEDKEGF